jgi:hypothetical protein
MAEHSKVPWMTGYDGHGGMHLTAADGSHVGYLSLKGKGEQEANARRVVACVNAMEGVPTEDVEAGVPKSTVRKLAAGNAELLAACEALDRLDCCDGYSFPETDWPKLWEALSLARAALAKAKGVEGG